VGKVIRFEQLNCTWFWSNSKYIFFCLCLSIHELWFLLTYIFVER